MPDAVGHAILQDPPGTGAIPGGGAFELWRVFNSELVNGTAAVDSVAARFTDNQGASVQVNGFLLTPFHHFGVWVQATSATGTANVQLQILQSYNDTAANYVVPNVGGTIASTINDELPHVYSVSPVPMPRLRFRVTGNTGNPADTVVTLYAWWQRA